MVSPARVKTLWRFVKGSGGALGLNCKQILKTRMIGVEAVVLWRNQGGDAAHDLVGVGTQAGLAFCRIERGKVKGDADVHGEEGSAQAAPGFPSALGTMDANRDERYIGFVSQVGCAGLTACKRVGFTASAFGGHTEDFPFVQPIHSAGDSVTVNLTALDEDAAGPFEHWTEEQVPLVFFGSPTGDIFTPEQAIEER